MAASALFVSCILSETSDRFILLTSLYHEKKEERIKEYKKCLLKNLEHPLIEKLIVFFDTKNPDPYNKLLSFIKSLPIAIEYIQGRPSFKSLFDYAAHNYDGRKIIVCNADIFFNDTLEGIQDINFENLFIALTRWDEVYPSDVQFFNIDRSQDAWIFRAPFKATRFPLLELGTWQCDSMIARCAFENGYNVINPSFEVQACHVHNSNLRNYTIPAKWPMSDTHNFSIPFGWVATFLKSLKNLISIYLSCAQKLVALPNY